MGTVVALAGQVGGAKLADGLYRLRGKDLAVVVNTADDYEHLGLHVAPDLDTTLYMLAGIASPNAAWEPDGETRVLHGMLKALGGPERPAIGDKSLAAPILRTEWLRNDRRLTQVSLEFCRRLGVTARVLPMSDDPVHTHVLTEDGAVTFHEYFNDLGCEPV
ncbi:MAG TPA: 2-phospho-L-lactate transferase CofD family protein, partial [Burkholderiales bacterium]|nr:2-phospho-L-lactate transferase CofD family protein [Burkholderiales bacterium]